MLKFVLCDDNPVVLDKLSDMLEAIFMENNLEAEVTYTSTKADNILEFVNTNEDVNVLILDINLKSNISGIELAERVREKNKDIYIIFSTGHLEYALVAYRVKTFDYLSKPITQERLEETVLRLFNDMSKTKTKRYIRLGNNILNQNDVHFIKKDGMKLIFYTSNTHFETYNSITKIQESLPENFIRCHKSYIANLDKILTIENATNTIQFNNHTKCYIGPKYKNNFMEVFKNYGDYNKCLNHT